MKKNRNVIIIFSIIFVAIISGAIGYFAGVDNNVPKVADVTAEEVTLAETTEEISQSLQAEEVTENTIEILEELTVEEEEATKALAENYEYNQLINGKWKPVQAININIDEEVDFSLIYGSSFRTYGGSLVFDAEKGTFSLWMGVGTDDGSHDGTYNLVPDFYDYDNPTGEITLNFENGKTSIFTCDNSANKNSDYGPTIAYKFNKIIMKKDIYNIIFERDLS